MEALVWLSILAATAAAPIEARYPQAIEVYHNRFDEAADQNFDQWPDNWTRRRGQGFPHYVKVQIAAEPSSPVERALRVDLNGGAVLVQSPPLGVHGNSSYVLEVLLKTQGLTSDEAYVSLTFLNASHEPLETFRSASTSGSHEWQKVRLGPVATEHREARFVLIGLHLSPTARPDLKGTVQFSDLWLGSLPRMTLETNGPHHLFQPGAPVEIICHLSGFSESQGQLTFELFDALGTRVDQWERPLEAAAQTGARASNATAQKQEAAVTWKPKIGAPGFYRADVAMHTGDRLVLRRHLTLAVIPRAPVGLGNEFGWSLPRGEEPLSLAALPPLLAQASVGWIKFPLWFSDKDAGKVEGLVRFVERLSSQRIEIVGLLDNPPPELREKFGNKDKLSAADLFTPEPEVWYPSIEPVMTQLSMKVRRWQLGSDDDTSFVRYPELRTKISQIKKQFDRIGQDVQLGLGWRWLDEVPAANMPWSFVTLVGEPSLTPAELAAYLPPLATSKTARWVAVEPLSREHYSTVTRAADLVHRLVAAKKHGAERIFVPQPFSDTHGLLNEDGTPGELLLPWQAVASSLSGAEYLGSLQLPGGSPNELFARGNEAILVVWNRTPGEETLELGSDVEQLSLWGGRRQIPAERGRQLIEVGPLPTIVTGLNLSIARCALSFEMSRSRFPSVFGAAHPCSLVFTNHFPRGASGKIRFVVPDAWQASPREIEFKLPAGEETRPNFDLRFAYDANSGPQDLRIEVEMVADRAYEFRLFRRVQIGLGDLTLEAASELADNGELIVRQRLHNHTDQTVSFRCDLFAANRRRLRTQVFDLARGEDVQTYRLPAGKELIGQELWIRAEEIGGPRVLSHRFRAGE
jgi:hypothetical protein